MSFAAVVERLQKLENPYPGLRPFDVTESHLFFGRDLQVADLVRRLERHRFVAVLGVSGSGKSSLVRAGLIPSLERGGVWEAGRRWRQVVTQPAGAPFESLAADLRKAGLDASNLRASSHSLIEVQRQLPADESLLLVVDQFEELFRYKDLLPITDQARRIRERHAADAAEFVQLLLEASRHHPPIYTVLTMRSDYLGDCAEFRDLPETLNDCQYLVPRMTRQERKEAIEGPLGRVKIAPSLVQRMLNDAGDDPEQLPVLQHALMRTWSQWRKSDPDERRGIELQDYEETGGFDGALNRHAEELLAGVPDDVAECIFKRLTARGRSNRERRDPATLAELWGVCRAVTPERQAQVTAVINRFRQGDATFLRPLAGAIGPETYIDITHESLIRLWKKLRDEWLPAEQLSAKTLVDVAERARNWKAAKGELLVGLDLARVVAWDRERNKTAVWAQHYVDEGPLSEVVDFVAASRARQRRRVLLRRALWSAAVLLVLILTGGSVWTSIQNQRRQDALDQEEALQEQAKELRAVSEQEVARLESELASRTTDVPPPTAGPPTAAELKPRVYIQVRNPAEATRARKIAPPLEKAGYIVPRPEILDTGPSTTEVRYFRAAERERAVEIAGILKQTVGNIRVLHVAGYGESKDIRRNHFELWLAPADLLPGLVRQLNDGEADVRKLAGGRLGRDHRANPEAIRLVLDTLSEHNLRSLSSEGRINALYFLNRSDLTAWTPEHKKLAREAIVRIRSRDAAGIAALGSQTRQELGSLERRISAY